jgi:serine phosphatase RsbU (regulator of sigma subunit)
MTERLSWWRSGKERHERIWLAGALAVLGTLALVTALQSAVLVSTLGIVVVVAGLVSRPRIVVVVALVAVTLAVLLVLAGSVAENGWLRVGNVVVGSLLGLSASVSRTLRTRQIERLQNRDAALLAGLPDAVLRLDGSGAITFANPAARALLGLDGRAAPEPIRSAPAIHDLAAHRDADGEVCPGGCGLSGRQAPASTADGARSTSGLGEELTVAGGNRIRVDWTAVPLDDGHDADGSGSVLVLRDAAPRLAALEQAAQLAEARREGALQRRYLDVLERALRPPPPTVPGLDLGIVYVSADEGAPTGGDLHDAVVLPDGRLYLLVVDVLGHGVASTRDALRLVHAARVLVMGGVRPGLLAARLDATADPSNRVMATLVAALFDPGTGRIEVAAAGHPPALLVHGGGGTRWLESSGRPVGAPLAGTDEVAVAELRPGDTVLLYTDGLVEARRDIVAGMEQLPRHAGMLRTRPAEAMAQRLAELMLDGATRRDDTLLLALRINRLA